MSIKLLPCPFCGGEAEITRFGDRRQSTQYTCTHCGCFLETGETFDFGRDWNERFVPKQVIPEGVRQSTLTWSDVEYLNRKLADTQKELMKYACGGFKKTGLSDDKMCIISMMELRDLLDKMITESKKQNKKGESFLFTGVPTFDQKAWDKILEEKGLQGLA